MVEVFKNIGLILVFILIGGVFSAAEMALVSLRESQIKQLATRGKRGQAIARLTENPNRFLSAVQIGVTLAGFLSASFGGATLAGALSPVFVGWGMPKGVAETLALVLITVIISYFSIVLSELTAKRLAMQRAEGFGLALAPLVDGIAKVARPLIWFLGRSTDLVVRILGGDPGAAREEVSDEEIRAMLSGSQTLGDEERHIVDEVFGAGDRSLREVMVPRTEVDFLPGDMAASRALATVQGAPHSRYPVSDGGPDRIVGFLHVRDLMDLDPVQRSTPLRQLARPVMSLPETVRMLKAMTEMRRQRSHMAIVVDEYGGTSGIVTLEDIMEELVGDILDEYDVEDVTETRHRNLRDVDGLMTLEAYQDQTGYVLPEGPYDTVAGYFMAQLGKVPDVGDAVEVELERAEAGTGEDEDGLPPRMAMRFEVAELDGRRVAWLQAVPLHPGDGPDHEANSDQQVDLDQQVVPAGTQQTRSDDAQH